MEFQIKRWVSDKKMKACMERWSANENKLKICDREEWNSCSKKRGGQREKHKNSEENGC